MNHQMKVYNENETEIIENLSKALKSNPEQLIESQRKHQKILISTCKHLFSSICKELNLESTLPNLYCGDDENNNDTEMIWEQIELLNEHVVKSISFQMKALKKGVKKRDDEKHLIRLLDWDGEDSEKEDDSKKEDTSDEEDDSEEDEEDDDSETKRMKARMKRAMIDDDDDDDEEEEEEEEIEMKNNKSLVLKEKEEEYDSDNDAMAKELNDGFFSLKDMEDFADIEEDFHDDSKDETFRDDEDVNLLYQMYQQTNTEEDDDEVINMTAADFFGDPNKKRVKKVVHWNDNNDNHAEITENKTNEEVVESAPVNSELAEQTAKLEKELLSQKPWQYTGEIKSNARPENSLLDETPQFEMAQKIAPQITIEHTANLEEMIQKRILNDDWDDVIPRAAPVLIPKSAEGSHLELSQEKSKLSLGDLYEREFLKKSQGYDVDQEEKQSKLDVQKEELRKLFGTFCGKLDALSNYHFTPRPTTDASTDIEFKTAAPAISVEEVLPMYVSDKRRIAPEEVYKGKDLKDDPTQQERKRLRSKKKQQKRRDKKEKLAKEKILNKVAPSLGLNNPYERRKMEQELNLAKAYNKIVDGADGRDQESLKKLTSSTTFFKRLEEEKNSKRKTSNNDNYDNPKSKRSKAIKL